VSAQRVQAQPDGRYELTLKTPWRDGTQAVTLSALKLTGRLAASRHECGGKRSLVSLIQQPAVIKEGRTIGAQTSIVVHLKLPTELHTRGDPRYRTAGASTNTGMVRGPPSDLFPWDVSETGELLFEADDGHSVVGRTCGATLGAVDQDPDLPFLDDDLAA
jgi:hypothetical protein